jgi:hypothetical protein
MSQESAMSEEIEDLREQLAESRLREAELRTRFEAHDACLTNKLELVKQLQQENDRLRDAIRWALGEGDSDFGNNLTGNEPRYWWRKELRKRAAMQAKEEKIDPAKAIFEKLQSDAKDIAKRNRERGEG